MTIQTSNENQRAFSDSQMDERVVWDDNQRADLDDDDLEKYLVEAYDAITYVDEDAVDVSEVGVDEDEPTVEEEAAEAVDDLESEGEGDADDSERDDRGGVAGTQATGDRDDE